MSAIKKPSREFEQRCDFTLLRDDGGKIQYSVISNDPLNVSLNCLSKTRFLRHLNIQSTVDERNATVLPTIYRYIGGEFFSHDNTVALQHIISFIDGNYMFSFGEQLIQHGYWQFIERWFFDNPGSTARYFVALENRIKGDDFEIFKDVFDVQYVSNRQPNGYRLFMLQNDDNLTLMLIAGVQINIAFDFQTGQRVEI